MRSSSTLLAYAGLALSLARAGSAHAQSRVLAPARQGARVLQGIVFPPPDLSFTGYVTGDALLLRDSGGLMLELSQLCAATRTATRAATRTATRTATRAATRTATDSAQAAIRRRISELEERRTRTSLRLFSFGSVPPGRYVALAWTEFQWPPTQPGQAGRVSTHFGVDQIRITPRTDSALVMFNTGRKNSAARDTLSNALRCLEFLLVPSPADRVVLPHRPARDR